MNTTRLMQGVDQTPDLGGAGIAYVGNRQCTFVRDSDHPSGRRTYAVFQQVERTGLFPVSAIPFSASRTSAPKQYRVASTVGAEFGQGFAGLWRSSAFRLTRSGRFEWMRPR